MMKTIDRLRRISLLLAVLLACALCAYLGFLCGEGKERALHTPGHNDPNFRDGFVAGVRFGIVARAVEPEQNDIYVITRRAALWYCAAENAKAWEEEP